MDRGGERQAARDEQPRDRGELEHEQDRVRATVEQRERDRDCVAGVPRLDRRDELQVDHRRHHTFEHRGDDQRDEQAALQDAERLRLGRGGRRATGCAVAQRALLHDRDDDHDRGDRGAGVRQHRDAEPRDQRRGAEAGDRATRRHRGAGARQHASRVSSADRRGDPRPQREPGDLRCRGQHDDERDGRDAGAKQGRRTARG